MDDQVVGDDAYFDDDLDFLPGNTFTELEENAFKATQRSSSIYESRLPAFKHPQRPDAAALASGFGRLSAVVNGTNHTNTGQQNVVQNASSDYGELDGEMLDGEIFDANEEPALAAAARHNHSTDGKFPRESEQREQWRQQRYSTPHANTPYRNVPVHVPRVPIPRHHDVNLMIQSHRPNESGGSSSQAAKDRPLESEMAKFSLEREELLDRVQGAVDAANAKIGEIAIVRANASKLEKEYDARVRALEKSHTDEITRQRSELESVKADLQKLATEKKFLENEVNDGTKQIRHLQKAAKKVVASTENASGKATGASTPKRQRIGLGDGFDNDEVQPQSPSKLVHRTKPATPKTGSKRKRRPAEESPTRRSLEFDGRLPDDSFSGPSVVQVEQQEQVTHWAESPSLGFVFMQQFLDHHSPGSEERIVEALARYHFPSEPKVALSTMILDRLSPKHLKPSISDLPAAVALEVIHLWRQCIGERYHEPIHLLLDLVRFTLAFKPYRVAPELTNDLMSLLQETADIIIIPRCQKKPPRNDRALISSTACLEVINMMALALSISAEESQRFWRTMRFDFLMMLLSFINPLADLQLIVRILRTSVLSNSFAMIIPPNDGKQDATEARVIDNLSRLLVEPPRPNQSEAALTGAELADLRLAILALIEDMAANHYAAMAVCQHKLLLGRTVRLMNDSLASAYDDTPARTLLIELVNSATRLFFYFMQNYAEHFNLQEKLSVVPGGEKKFLIVLTRLAFSEGMYIEGGIEDDVSDIAHRLLEDRVSPEEAESLVAVMSTAPATRASNTRRESVSEDAQIDEDPN